MTEGLARDGRRRVVLCSDSLVVGGAERSLVNLVGAHDGSTELAVCSPSPDLLAECRDAAPRVETRLMPVGLSFPAAVGAHRAAFAALGANLVQITLCNPFAGRPALIAARSLRLPTIAVEQLVLPARRRRGAVAVRITARLLAAHVAVGEATALDLERFFGIPRSTVTVIHNGVARDTPPSTDLGRRPVVGSAGRLEDQKQLDVLVRAMVDLPGVRLVLVGDGERRGALSALASRLSVADRTEFVGWVPDARPFIAGMDVFVLPSRDEAFPLTIVEAMFAGTPVVATDVGSVREAVVDGETGMVVRSGDVDALAAAIRQVLDDPGLRERVIANARRLAEERFSVQTMARAYDSLWNRVLVGSSSSSRADAEAGGATEGK